MAESNNSKSDYSSSVTIKSTSPTTTRRRRRWKNMDKKIRSELTSQDIRDLRDVFDAFDREQHGFISILDLRKALRVLGFRIKRNDVYEIARDVGIERLGDVSFSEMLEVIISMQGDSRDEYEEISQGFKMLDTGI
ncbi:centrin-3-like isoform X2 [Apostichopus japonicus]|uniref:centrin-3-like isoform X2 n=1 Tax=Stichopus japonicus TaxID=307972 RepID=UPI003AB3FB66